jgi:hypothetical protein
MTTPARPLDIDSLARGDLHMLDRFVAAWNACRAERATWPSPFAENYEELVADISTEATEVVIGYLRTLANAWVRHLLCESGVKPGDLPPPTSSQTRTLIRRLNRDGTSGDDGLELLTFWASAALRGDDERMINDLDRLAGDMRLDVLNSVINHVRRTSLVFNGRDVTLMQKPNEPEAVGG